ncbi:hypothetical protein AGOR_G00167610 [Albula goreensis]|uniref:Spermatogenesis-associated protein 2 PUB-like domain-containing protein n=1 Tax=Albula goreensis TaxID=1534307 RepID=A0A8T3D2I6_9TELE|nr:hypothetical protein AGOR_G00167610 [Albula goreensis]
MKRVMEEEKQISREEVFTDYLTYYKQVWPQGDLRVCQEAQMTDRAKNVLLAESSPDSRFTVFDFYRTVSECLQEDRINCRDVLQKLIKATEVLEMLCINLFLFPWKKEIKTLKTFTGPFVYWIKPVLPLSSVKGILESIGYHPETETEYRLDKSADSDKVMRMAFELFLARQECEYLLEVMEQSHPWKHLGILQERSLQASPGLREAVGGMAEERTRGGDTVLQSDAEEGFESGHSLVDPGAVLTEGYQAVPDPVRGGDRDSEENPPSLEFQPPDSRIRSFMTNDKAHQAGGERRAPEGAALVGSELSGPQSIAGLHESHPSTNNTVASPKLRRPEVSIKRLPDSHVQVSDPEVADSHIAPTPSQGLGPSGAQGGPEDQAALDEDIVMELTERIGQMTVKDHHVGEILKFPVEETAHLDPSHYCSDANPTPLSSPRDKAKPGACFPSAVPLCSIPDCRSCSQSDAPCGNTQGCDTIKEPPQSFYIPPQQMEHADSPSPDPRGPQAPPGAPPPPPPQVEDLLKSYVMVDHV